MLRYSLLLSLAAAAVSGQNGSLDPEFRKVPFDSWFPHAGETRIKWKAQVLPPQLSAHQRLLAQVETVIDGAEFEKRLGTGQFFLFVQLTDAHGRRYQNHAVLNLEKMQEGIRKQDVSCSMPFFVLPGDYNVALALYGTATGEHSTKEAKLHVDTLKEEPLPEMWRDLPPVEFIPAEDPPDSWFMPGESGRLCLPVTTHRKTDLEVIVNLTPSERLSGSTRAQDRNLGRLIPALKTMSRIDLSNGVMDVELLDLSRHRVTFRQESVDELDWPAMKEKLVETKPGVIDVKSLEQRGQSAAFFVKEVAHRLNADASGVSHVLIVLSSPVQFERGEELSPIPVERAAGTMVFYIRYHAPVALRRLPMNRYPVMGRSRPFGGPGRLPPGSVPIVDQLAGTLKPLAPRLFDVETAEDFRKALAAILNDISRGQ